MVLLADRYRTVISGAARSVVFRVHGDGLDFVRGTPVDVLRLGLHCDPSRLSENEKNDARFLCAARYFYG